MALSMYSGEARSILLVFTAADGSGLLDIGGCHLIWEAKPYGFLPDTDPRTIVKTTANGGIVINPDQSTHKGEATVTLASVDTASVSGTYVCGCRLFPGAIVPDQETLTITRATVGTTTSP